MMFLHVWKYMSSLGRFHQKPCLNSPCELSEGTVDQGFLLDASWNLCCDITEVLWQRPGNSSLLSCFLSSLNIMHTVNVILWDCSELQHVKQSRKKAGHQWHAWIGEEVGNTFTHILTLWNQCVAAPVRGCCPFTGMPLTLSECQWLWQQKHGMG